MCNHKLYIVSFYHSFMLKNKCFKVHWPTQSVLTSSFKDPLSLTVMHCGRIAFTGPTKVAFCVSSRSGKQIRLHWKDHCMFWCTFSFKGKILRLVVTLRCYYFTLWTMVEGFSFCWMMLAKSARLPRNELCYKLYSDIYITQNSQQTWA